MVFFKSVAAATAALSLISHSSATYNSASPANLAMYWGQGPNQDDLQTFCQSSSVDIIPIGFINNFVAQANGWVGNNHGNKCWGEGYGYYKAPGWPTTADYVPSKDLVFQQCGNVRQAIPICQGLNKKMILSLGGEWNTLTGATYQLTGAKEGIALAEFLWGAYGTYDANSDYIKNGGVRPLDGGFWGLDGTRLEVDGFDFDIEHPPTDNGAGYIACINRLRELFATKGQKGKEYLITGAPQCKFPDASLGKVIEAVKFDALFIQFYNTPECAAAGTGFNFKQWSTGITGPSKDAKLYIGLPGSPEAAIAGNYIEATAAKTLIDKNINDPKFGGVMIWEATYAKNNTKNGRTYNEVIKEDCLNPHAPTSTSSSYIASSTTTSRSSSSTSSSYIASSTTSSSSSSSSTSSSYIASSTTSSSTTSSSSSSSSTSSSYIASSTTSSSTTSPSSSSSSTSSSYIASSTTSSSSSSSSTSSSYIASSTSSSSTSSSYIASSTTSSSSSSSTSSTLSPTSSSSSSSTSSSSSSYIASSTTTSGSSSSASSLSSSTTTTYTPSSTSVSSSSSSTSETSTGGPSTTSKSSTSISETSTSESTPYPTFTTTSGSSVPTSPYPTSSGDGVPTSSSSSCSSSSSTTEYTTSTVYTTRVETVTSCAPTVTNCPSGPHVTTVTIPLYTTVCPVTKTHTPSPSGPATSPSAPSAPHTTQYTTSTIYTTKVHTITACPPSEIHCPVGSVTTETISLTTTVYPIVPTFKPTISIPSYPSSTPEGGVPNVPNYVPSNSHSTSTRKQTLTLYTTIKAVKSTATIVPSIVTVQPTPKYPAGPVKSYIPVGSGTGLPPSYPVTTSVAGGVKPYPSAVPSQIQQGAGSRIGVSSIMIALVMGVVVLMV